MTSSKRHHYRIYSPVRFFIFVFLTLTITVFSIYSIIGASNAQAAGVRNYAQVMVGQDDSLWSIVEAYNPDANIDIRDALYDIYEINDITADDLQPGDTIFVPIY